VRCRQCEYPLWNLPTRACPECGLPFRPSEYEFVPGTVEFCCPHCGQGYFGTSAEGHLRPESFECVACHAWMTMDEAMLRPAPGVDESQTLPIKNPWLSRQRLGFFRAFFSTLGKTLTAPGNLLRVTPPGTAYGAGRGFFFLILAWLLGTTVVGMAAVSLAAGFSGMAMSFAFCGLWANPLVIIAWFIAVLLWGVAAHLILLMTGGAKHGISRTYEALCYGAGPMVMLVMPCIGPFACIWSIVSSTIAFKAAQKVGGGRASLCVVTPPLVVMVLLFVGWMAFVMWVMSTMPAPGGMGSGAVAYTTTPDQQARTLTGELLGLAERNNGAGPTHGLELLDRASVVPQDFATIWPVDIPYFGPTLARFHTMMPQERAETLASAARMINERTVAHRVGDVVLTYHGIADLRAANPGLWIVVICEDPSETMRSIDPIWVGRADGSIIAVPQSGFAAALDAQNLLRAENGLPPLPDPREIDPSQPAERD